jgi:hypothetical protein
MPVKNIIRKLKSLALSVWPFFSALVAKLVCTFRCDVVTSFIFFNPILALNALPTFI